MKITKEQAQLVSKLLRITEEEAVKYSHEVEGVDAVYISIPEKGGASMLVSPDLEVLYAISSVSFDKHLEAYKSGMRTPLEAFEE
ncbi:MAG: hypothetical protein IJM96_01195 [Clostridia bacterium]|nr:hypothetical protein [Clostridia bacterium]MBQ6868188.1 hypothetical protein [Clostridia bacterium]MBQ7086075.1 hypothetical protein [Clostridia bacterium]MBQ7092982.1 hypothetical protein [Clostridia bacterium]